MALEVPLGVKAQAILAAARICFARSGFHGASMADIAAEAKISVGHIYRYFAGKEAVIASLVEQDLEAITRDIESLSGSPQDMAATIVERVKERSHRMRMELWLEVLAEGGRNPKIAGLVRCAELRVQDKLREAAFACAGAEPLRPACDRDIAERLSFIGLLLNGLQVRSFVEGGELPQGLAARVQAQIAAALSPPPEVAGASARPERLSRRGD